MDYLDGPALSPVANARVWLLLVTALPREDVGARMGTLRTIETVGAVALREGVFLLPGSAPGRDAFMRLADRIRRARGDAHIFETRTLDTAETVELVSLFDRNPRYAEIIKTVESLRAGFGVADPGAIAAVLGKQRRDLDQISAVDFFSSNLRREAERVLTRSEQLMRKLNEEPAGRG